MQTKTKVGRASPKVWRTEMHYEESTIRGGQKAAGTAAAKGGVKRNPNFLQPGGSKDPLRRVHRPK
jgi:hypothetical protein